MKKYRRSLLSLLLALSLSLSLTTPWALASSAAPEDTEAPVETTPPGPVVEEKTPVESQLLNDMHIEATAAILVDAATGTVLKAEMDDCSGHIKKASPLGMPFLMYKGKPAHSRAGTSKIARKITFHKVKTPRYLPRMSPERRAICL